MSDYVHKSHNVNVALYHFVFPTKYRRVVIAQKVDSLIKQACDEVSQRYEIHFVEIGADKDHIHFLIQSVPMWNITKIVTTVKSITARYVFKQMPELKIEMWGASLWTSGYFVSTVGKHGSEKVITNYVRQQGREDEYKQIEKNQLKLFD